MFLMYVMYVWYDMVCIYVMYILQEMINVSVDFSAPPFCVACPTMNQCRCGRCEDMWLRAGWQCWIPASLNGYVGGQIRLMGGAIVMMCGDTTLFQYGATGAHVTICWRRLGFADTDVEVVVRLRAKWLQRAERRVRGGRFSCISTSFETNVKKTVFILDSACDVVSFIQFVHSEVPTSWFDEHFVGWTPHVSVNRTRRQQLPVVQSHGE